MAKKALLLICFMFSVPLMAKFTYTCSGKCPAGCDTYSISYEVDCNGLTTSYESTHTYPDGTVVNDSSLDDTGTWSGINPADIGCETNHCI